MNPVIRSDDNPKLAMAATVLGALINVICDPIFIYVFRWGMMGAALATMLGQIVTAMISIWYLFHLRSVQLKKSSFYLNGHILKKSLFLVLCSFLSQISLVLSMVARCIPIVGYNIGAKRFDRAKTLFLYLLCGESLVGLIATVIVELFPFQLIALFGSANESVYYTQFAVKSFRIYLCMMIFACINKATFIYLQSLGKALLSTLLSMIREVVFGVGFALLLPLFFGLDGVLYSMPLSDILTFIISVICIVYSLRFLNQCAKETDD